MYSRIFSSIVTDKVKAPPAGLVPETVDIPKRVAPLDSIPKGGRVTQLEKDIEPGWDFVEQIRAFGKRPGESALAFETRLAGVKKARELWLQAAVKHPNNITQIAMSLGVTAANANRMMRRCGLNKAMLREYPQKLKEKNP